MNETLYLKCRKKHYNPKHVCEVGVYYPETSNILGFISDGLKATLIEPLPECVEAINLYFSDNDNVSVHPYAIADESGEIELFKFESSSFVSSLEETPALKNDNYNKSKGERITVISKRFDEIDDGTIDLISIDVEGSEWFVLKHMKSRPGVISLELKSKYYVNPHLNEINNWLADNCYIMWFTDRSDTVFVNHGIFELSIFEKIKNKIK